jgi:aminobutyraldehyde dehydrogenase
VFGPVVSVTRFDDAERAIAWANDSDYGLRVIGMDQGRVQGHANGRAAFNTAAPGSTAMSMLTNEMPHGGAKSSGYGKDLSSYALEDYTVVRHVMVKSG